MIHIRRNPVLRILSVVCIAVVLKIAAGCAVYHLEPRLAEEAPLLEAVAMSFILVLLNSSGR